MRFDVGYERSDGDDAEQGNEIDAGGGHCVTEGFYIVDDLVCVGRTG
jgi:hypothetical protein